MQIACFSYVNYAKWMHPLSIERILSVGNFWPTVRPRKFPRLGISGWLSGRENSPDWFYLGWRPIERNLPIFFWLVSWSREISGMGYKSIFPIKRILLVGKERVNCYIEWGRENFKISIVQINPVDLIGFTLLETTLNIFLSLISHIILSVSYQCW